MKRKLCVVLALAMALSITACGGKGKTTETEATTEATTEAKSPEEMYPATIDPRDIHPGSLNSDEDTSERWYPEGDTSSAMCFTLTQTRPEDDCVGLAICFYKTIDGNDDDLIDMPLRDGGNGHAITKEFTFMKDKSETYDFDFTFQDNFTCYDFKSGKVWKRAHPEYGCKDQSWYDDAFKGLVAYRDLASGAKFQQIVMNDDGTFVESVTDMDDMTGRWEVQGSNVLMLIYDNEGDGVQTIDGGGLLENGGEDADETTTGNTWQQEFNISADGKVTEFGLFPVYDDDMNLTGYDAAFELTTKDELDALEKEKQEKADASKAAGSPYPVPEVENIMDITLEGVNMDQDPDYVVETMSWDDKTFANQMRDGDLDGYVFEVHGFAEKGGFYVPYDDGEHKAMFMIWPINGAPKPKDATNIVLKGVLWHYGSNYYVFYDADHITYDE